MPKLHYPTKYQANLSPNMKLGIQATRFDEANLDDDVGVWTARIKFPAMDPKFKSTKVKYDGGSKTARQNAEEIAWTYFYVEQEKVNRGLDIHDVHYIDQVANEYLTEAETFYKENDERVERGGTPVHEIEGGRGYWTEERYKRALSYQRNYLLDYFEALKNDKDVPLYVEAITERDLDNFDRYMRRLTTVDGKDISISTRLKINTEMRHIMKFAKRKGYIDTVPNIQRPRVGSERDIRARQRREISPEDYRKIIQWQRDQYTGSNDTKRELTRYIRDKEGNPIGEETFTTNENEIYEVYRDYQYLFHLWTLIIANCGIRPPTSGREHTLIKWEHVRINDEDRQRPTLYRPDEKGKEYEAVIMPQALIYWDELRNFYDDRGFDTTEGYCFRHLEDKKNRDGTYSWNKGDPIYSFRRQWERMTTELGLRIKGGNQSDNVSPSSLRAWFITQRLYSDDNIRIEELASAVGSSVGQIMLHYYRLDMKERHHALTIGGYDTGDKAKTYTTVNGRKYYTGHSEDE